MSVFFFSLSILGMLPNSQIIRQQEELAKFGYSQTGPLLGNKLL
jgi:hypothetical protein